MPFPVTKLHFITALLVDSARLATVSGLLLGRHFDRQPPLAWHFFHLYHVFLNISLFNLVKKETAVKTAHHCSWSSTLCPQLLELFTKNSLVFNKTPFSFHGYSNHGHWRVMALRVDQTNFKLAQKLEWPYNLTRPFYNKWKEPHDCKGQCWQLLNFVNKIFQYFQEFLAVWNFLSYRWNKYWCYKHDFRVSLFVSTAIIERFSIHSLRFISW